MTQRRRRRQHKKKRLHKTHSTIENVLRAIVASNSSECGGVPGDQMLQDKNSFWPGTVGQQNKVKHRVFKECARALASASIPDKQFSPYYN